MLAASHAAFHQSAAAVRQRPHVKAFRKATVLPLAFLEGRSGCNGRIGGDGRKRGGADGVGGSVACVAGDVGGRGGVPGGAGSSPGRTLVGVAGGGVGGKRSGAHLAEG